MIINILVTFADEPICSQEGQQAAKSSTVAVSGGA